MARIVVLGAGVIGITTAYYLAKAGCQVTVVERQGGPALETSFANAGQISPGYAAPWAAPGVPTKALKWLLQAHAPLKIRPDGTRFQLSWMKRMLANCTPERYTVNKARMMRLAEYSRDCFKTLREDIGIRYEERSLGTLQLFRTQAQVDAMQKDIAVLRECGVPYRVLTRAELPSVEPALACVSDKLSGGLQLPNDETGDCQLFCTRLAEHCKTLGVVFEWGQSIENLVLESVRVAGVRLRDGRVLSGDHYVLACGSYSTELLRHINIDIPVYPVKGYSLTVPIVDGTHAPVSTVLDETYKVAITRFDQRIRIGGMAELAGFDLSLNPRRRQTLEMVLNDLYPGSGDLVAASFWTGLRPMTPDGTPIIGATRYRNLSLNTGHGTLGWTMSAGSARVLADQIMGRQPDIAADDLSMARY